MYNKNLNTLSTHIDLGELQSEKQSHHDKKMEMGGGGVDENLLF